MKLKKTIAILLAAVTALTVSGCGRNEAAGGKVKLTVYLYGSGLLNGYAQAVQKLVPDVELEFVTGRDSIDFYLLKQQHGDMPDIITMGGGLSMRESVELNRYLMDLSETEIAATFYKTYLESYRSGDGTVKWLPAGCVANGILANTELFNKYDIPLPTDYASFAAACEAFREVGVKPYTSDYKYTYTCLYTLEGMSMSHLMSRQGTSWRRDYESGLTDSLDERLWTDVFERYSQFIRDTGIGEEEITRGFSNTQEDFREGSIAMIRGASSEVAGYMNSHETTLLPYFGDTEDDNWLLTSPRFIVGLSGELENADKKKKDAALKVLEAMFAQESYDAMTEGDFGYMLPYNRGVTANLHERFENITPLIEANHMYVLMSSTGLQNAALAAVHPLLRGETDARGAYEIMNAAVAQKAQTETAATITLQNAYSITVDPKKGSEAASSVVNTMRKVSGSDMLLAPSAICTGSFYEGDYTRAQIEETIQVGGNRIYSAELSGAQIREFVTAAVEGVGCANDPFSSQTLPVASGFSINVEKTDDGYRLTDILVNEAPLADDAVYMFAVADIPSGFIVLAEHIFGEGGMDKFTASEKVARDLWTEYVFDEGNQPEAPAAYLNLK